MSIQVAAFAANPAGTSNSSRNYLLGSKLSRPHPLYSYSLLSLLIRGQLNMAYKVTTQTLLSILILGHYIFDRLR